jgi:hypothetical protein
MVNQVRQQENEINRAVESNGAREIKHSRARVHVLRPAGKFEQREGANRELWI